MATKRQKNRRNYYLVCYTRSGYPCYNGVFGTKAGAKEQGDLLTEIEQAFSYKIARLPDVSALEAWLDQMDWKVSVYYQDGEVYAELERYSKRGVDFILHTPMTPHGYREAVENIDPNEEVLTMWQGDQSYRDAMGDLATAWNDINDLKQLLLEQLKSLNV